MNVIRSLWASIQGDPIFMRRVNGWLTVFWIVMIPISLVTGWISSVTYVAALSLWALVSGHWSAWQAARVEVRQEKEAQRAEQEPVEQRVVDKLVEETTLGAAELESAAPDRQIRHDACGLPLSHLTRTSNRSGQATASQPQSTVSASSPSTPIDRAWMARGAESSSAVRPSDAVAVQNQPSTNPSPQPKPTGPNRVNSTRRCGSQQHARVDVWLDPKSRFGIAALTIREGRGAGSSVQRHRSGSQEGSRVARSSVSDCV